MARIKTRRFMLLAVTGLVAGLAGCGGGDGGSETETPAASQRDFQGAAVKGPLQQTSIGLFEFDSSGQVSRTGEEPLFEAVTDAQGNFQIPDLPGNLSALISASGGGFFDESDPSGTRFIQWPATAELLSFKPASLSTVAITPLSDYLVRKSRRDAASGLDFTHSINENRRQLREALGFDPLSVLPPNPTQPPPGASEDELQYAMFLGGVAMAVNSAALGMGLPEPDFDVLWALLSDLEDCSLDGRRFGTVLHVNDQPLPGDIDLDREIRRFRNNNFERLGSAALVAVDRQLCANALPRAVNDNATTSSGIAIEIPVLANDNDPDGNLVMSTLQITTQPANGLAEVVPGTGRIRYVPGEEFVGNDSFRYRVEDNRGARSNLATVSINVASGNTAPLAINDSFAVEQGGFFSTQDDCEGPCDLLDNEETSVLANDSDPDGDTLTLFEIVSPPQFAQSEGGFGMDSAGRFFYVHDGSANFVDSFTYRATDGDLQSNIATVQISISPDSACTAPPEGMVAWFTGDAAHTGAGVTYDIAGGHSGTLTNGAIAGFAPGQVAEAMDFDGVDDTIQVDGLAGFAPTDMTVDAWVRYDSLTNNDDSHGQVIVSKLRSGGQANDVIFVLGKNVNDNFFFGGFDAMDTPIGVEGTTPVQVGVWYHVAGVLRAGQLEIYVNGVQEGVNPGPLVLDHDNSQPVFIGSYGSLEGDPPSLQMNGQLDEVEIFDRALDPAEIADIYNAGFLGSCKPELSSDNDEDNLTLAEELALGTNPNSADTDGDGYDDDVEIAAGDPSMHEPALGDTNPLDSQSFPGGACLSPPIGMVAWYSGDFVDTSGTDVFDIWDGNTGVLQNGATSGVEPGVVAEAMGFDGVDDVVQVDGLATFAPTELTIDAWVNFDSQANANGSAYQAVAMKRRNGGFGQFESYMLGLDSLESRFVFLGFQALDPIYRAVSTTVMQPGVWYHIAGVVRDGELEIHVNGKREAVNPGPFVLEHDASQPVFIGGNGPNGGDANFPYQMDGRIDELEIFDRALDPDEIAALYNVGTTGKCRGF